MQTSFAISRPSSYERLMDTVRALMERQDLSQEEERLLELMAMLIEEYEDRVHPLPHTKPHRILAHLLEERGWKPSDLASVLPKSRTSEILSGKRSISKAQAKRLAELFRVPVELFL